MEERTIPNLFEKSCTKYPENIAVWEKLTDKYEGTTYSKLKAEIYDFAGGLLALGLNKGDRIGLISEGRKDWVISELAILYCGAVDVPISVKIDELNDLKFRLLHSECRFVIVSGAQLPKIKKIKNDLPDLEKIIVLDQQTQYDIDETDKATLVSMGINYLRESQKLFSDRFQSIKENDFANICYTSGTTADPKGIILTHRNYTANVEQASSLLPVPEYYVSLLILPWDHSFAHTAGIYTLLKNGASMASIKLGGTPLETLKNIPINIKEIKPHFLLSVPALAKNFKKNIEKGIKEKGEKVEKLYETGLKIAYKFNREGYNKGKGFAFIYKPLVSLFDKLIFSKIRENFGGRLEFFIGGGALLDIELQKYFYALGIPMLQGYGLSEAAPIISANVPAKHKLGSSGSIVKNLQCKICDDNGKEVKKGEKGEIVVKGENVMFGYWKNEKATAETLKDGWLYTGDLGYIDDDGFLYVLGRFKSLLISNDGEKYSPESIEEAICEHSKLIDQVILYNNQSPYTVALVVPNFDALKKHCTKYNINRQDEEGCKLLIKAIDEEIAKFKLGGEFQTLFPQRWVPTTFALLGEAFSEQNKFLNSTLKPVRGKIIKYYKNRIDYLFTPEGKNINNHQNCNIISKI